MARVKKTLPQQPLLVRTHTLTAELDNFLKQLSQEASDTLGWSVSSSAVLRALLRHATQQTAPWSAEQLFPLIEQELSAGVVWGHRKK